MNCSTQLDPLGEQEEACEHLGKQLQAAHGVLFGVSCIGAWYLGGLFRILYKASLFRKAPVAYFSVMLFGDAVYLAQTLWYNIWRVIYLARFGNYDAEPNPKVCEAGNYITGLAMYLELTGVSYIAFNAYRMARRSKRLMKSRDTALDLEVRALLLLSALILVFEFSLSFVIEDRKATALLACHQQDASSPSVNRVVMFSVIAICTCLTIYFFWLTFRILRSMQGSENSKSELYTNAISGVIKVAVSVVGVILITWGAQGFYYAMHAVGVVLPQWYYFVALILTKLKPMFDAMILLRMPAVKKYRAQKVASLRGPALRVDSTSISTGTRPVSSATGGAKCDTTEPTGVKEGTYT